MKKNQFVNGKREGSWETYWGNRNLFSQGLYKNNLKEGIWKVYWNYGAKSSKCIYNKGEIEFKSSFFSSLTTKKLFI